MRKKVINKIQQLPRKYSERIQKVLDKYQKRIRSDFPTISQKVLGPSTHDPTPDLKMVVCQTQYVQT